MTLTEFILRCNEWPITWGFVRSWMPARPSPYSWLRILGITALTILAWALVVLVPGLLMFSVFASPSGLAYILPWIYVQAEWAACVGLVWGIVSRICWNQRAVQIAAVPESVEAGVPWPRRTAISWASFGTLYGFVVVLFTPFLLFHAIENTRGAWAWRKLKAELKASGECYELSCIAPKPARDAENFFATPFWQRFAYRMEPEGHGKSRIVWLHAPLGMPQQEEYTLPQSPKANKQEDKTRQAPTDGRTDLVFWAERFRSANTNLYSKNNVGPPVRFPISATPGDPAKDVLQALTYYDAILAEFASAATRPRNVYPVHYEEGFNALLPNLASFKGICQICELRSAAKLSTGDTLGAADDVRLAFRLSEAMSEEPLLISQLVRIACGTFSIHALWNGLADHRWNDSQLSGFQELLSKLDYAGGVARALEGERAFGNDVMERLLRSRTQRVFQLDQMGAMPGNGDETIGYLVAYLAPQGWFRENQVALLRGYQEILSSARKDLSPTRRGSLVTDQNRTAFDVAEDQILQRVKVPSNPHTVVAGMLLPALSGAANRVHRIEAMKRMAIVACALERFRLAHARFPEALGELQPTYVTELPIDWITDQPLHYLRTDDGWFRLWSVGLNGQDDGGVFRAKRDSKSVSSGDSGRELDWPWPVPVPSLEKRMF